MTKPSIVFAHGIWADGSCFQKLIPTLRAEGHEVMAAQYGLDTLKGDVDATIRTFGRVSGPIVLVGHSYGGTVITHAGMDPRVAALVYIAALGPDERPECHGGLWVCVTIANPTSISTPTWETANRSRG